MKYIIGIDPGMYGAFWVLNKSGSTGRWIDMPFKPKKKGKSQGLDEIAIRSFLAQFSIQDSIIILEKIFFSPLLRGKGGFQFGMYYGIVKGIAVGMGFVVKDVTPISWKSYYGLMSTKKGKFTKDHSIKKAITLNPLFRTKFIFRKILTRRKGINEGKTYTQTVKKDGRAEAYLIAEYGRKHFC